MKIKKLANSNIEFLTDSDELIAVMQQTGAQLIVNAEGIKIIQTGYPEFYIKTDDVVSTQLMPAGAIAFTGDTTALVALLSASFFVLTSENIAYDNTGTDLVATTVQDAITELATEWTETTVNITSAQILAMGLTPIELLPAPGVGEYYEYEGFMELTHNTLSYTTLDNWGIVGSSSYAGAWFRSSADVSVNDRIYQFNSKNPSFVDATNTDIVYSAGFTKGESIVLTTWNGVDPTGGDGTLKAKIKYKIVTFG